MNVDCPLCSCLDVGCPFSNSEHKKYIECLDCINSFKSELDDFLKDLEKEQVK